MAGNGIGTDIPAHLYSAADVPGYLQRLCTHTVRSVSGKNKRQYRTFITVSPSLFMPHRLVMTFLVIITLSLQTALLNSALSPENVRLFSPGCTCTPPPGYAMHFSFIVGRPSPLPNHGTSHGLETPV